MAQKLEAKGGNGGKEWDDGADHEGVSKIYIREGSEGIESIKFDYVKSGEPEAGQVHGGSGQDFTDSVRFQTLFHIVDSLIFASTSISHSIKTKKLTFFYDL